MIQSLEARTLLSVSATLSKGLLTVTGTPKADQIQIEVLANGVTVKDAGKVIFQSAPFSNDVFAGVVVNARAGKDSIDVLVNEGTFDITLNGQDGNDTISARTFHAHGPIVNGGNGADTISVENQIGFGAGSVIHGNHGADKITSLNATGSPGSTVFGDGGADDIRVISQNGGASGHTVNGGDGDDIIHGGALADNLNGNNGKDKLFGGDGDDRLNGGPGNDKIDGEAGADTAKFSRLDKFLNVESFV